jgi:hypothetical protein
VLIAFHSYGYGQEGMDSKLYSEFVHHFSTNNVLQALLFWKYQQTNSNTYTQHLHRAELERRADKEKELENNLVEAQNTLNSTQKVRSIFHEKEAASAHRFPSQDFKLCKQENEKLHKEIETLRRELEEKNRQKRKLEELYMGMQRRYDETMSLYPSAKDNENFPQTKYTAVARQPGKP